MLWVLILLGLSATCYSEEGPFYGSPADPEQPVSGTFFNAMFGVQSCVGQNCGDSDAPDQSLKYPVDYYESQFSDPEIQNPEPQHPDPTPAYPSNGTIHTYRDFCEGLLNTLQSSRHPDVTSVKFIVWDALVKYMSVFAEVESDICDPAIKLLDLIILAAGELRQDYIKDPVSCEVPVTTETAEYTTSHNDHTIVTSTYPHEKSHKTTLDYVSSEKPTEKPSHEGTEEPHTMEYASSEKPCPEEPVTPDYKASTVKPCTDNSDDCVQEIIEEKHDNPFVGSIRGVPGEHYPDYTEIPITTFSCAEKCIPGFYADLETGCQVFHVCYEHRRESFLCPVGTVFNQPILACDYWYSSNCSLAPFYYEVNCGAEDITKSEEIDTAVGELIESIIEGNHDLRVKGQFESKLNEGALDELVNFLPVKAKVTVFAETTVSEVDKIITPLKPVIQDVEEVAWFPEQSETELRVEIKKPVELVKPVLKVKSVTAKVVKSVPVAKYVTAFASLPVLAKVKMGFPVAKVLAAKGAVPVVAKSKLSAGKVIAVKAAVPVVAKAKLAAAAVPVVAKAKLAAAAVPVVAKAKLAAAAVPVVAKAKLAAAAVPVVAKAKLAAAVPVAKVASKASVPIVAKSKLVASKVAVPLAAKTKFAASVPVAAKGKFVVAVAGKAKLGTASKVAATKVAVPVKVLSAKGVVAKGAVAASVPVAKAAALKVPALKTKILAASVPFAKSTLIKSSLPLAKVKAVPALKAKVLKSASLPIVKGKLMALPLVKSKFAAPVIPLAKAKLAKAVAISPLTKKALALGYMKLLKAKKLALMG